MTQIEDSHSSKYAEQPKRKQRSIRFAAFISSDLTPNDAAVGAKTAGGCKQAGPHKQW